MNTAERKTRILIVGAGRGGRTLIELFGEDPAITIVGVVDLREDAPGLELARTLNIPTDKDFRKFLYNPAPDLIIDVTGNPEVAHQLNHMKAPESEIVGGMAARFMWALIQERRQKVLLEEKYRRILESIGTEADSEFIIGSSQEMQRIAHLVDQVAPTDSTVLIRGETGTGKEIVARAIHRRSRRAQYPLVTVNCTAFSENLIESELFGHKKGAFTGAVSAKVGLLEHADKGTLFLDEIGDMPMSMQAKLLRFLQTGEIRPIGDVNSHTVDVRIIAATNRNLEEAIKNGTFRSDLYYRLNIFTIELPPLRERREDIPLFAYHFLKLAIAKTNKKVDSISTRAMDYLCHYDWPGNLRELQGVMERAVILCNGPQIEPEHLPISVQKEPPLLPLNQPFQEARRQLLNRFEKEALQHLLRETGGNVSQAARKAGLPRRTFYRLMVKLNIDPSRYKQNRTR
ncbi:MAG: AAA family ATPase [Calditrichaeota bacterium]|nr:MAG: AAA family ATPase [Calditrichota bacterium]